MEIKTNGDSLRSVLKLSGDLDRAGAMALRRFWEAMPKNPGQELVLDFFEVGFIGASGLALLAEMAKQVSAKGQRMQLIRASPEALALLSSLQMDKGIDTR